MQRNCTVINICLHVVPVLMIWVKIKFEPITFTDIVCSAVFREIATLVSRKFGAVRDFNCRK